MAHWYSCSAVPTDAASIDIGTDATSTDLKRHPELLQSADFVIANPPFSLNPWGHEGWGHDPYGRSRYGMPPATRGDLAFVEHALLDDNGDGLGTPAEWFRGIRPVQKARDDAALDGYRAHQLHLLYSEGETAMPPELRTRRDWLELQVMELRDKRATLWDGDYFDKLEPLLREIAQIYEQSK